MKFRTICNIIIVGSLTIVTGMFAAENGNNQLALLPAHQGALVASQQQGQGLRPLASNTAHALVSSSSTVVPSSSYSVTDTVSRVVKVGPDATNNNASALAGASIASGTQITQEQYQGVIGALTRENETNRALQGNLETERQAKETQQALLTDEQSKHQNTKNILAKASNPSLIGTGCGIGNHVLCGFFGVPSQYAEPICSVLAPILSAAMDHKDGVSPISIAFRAAVSLIACRGTIDIGNTLQVASKIQAFKNKSEKDTLPNEETEVTQEPKKRTKKKQ